MRTKLEAHSSGPSGDRRGIGGRRRARGRNAQMTEIVVG
jgi:hypothetical protein